MTGKTSIPVALTRAGLSAHLEEEILAGRLEAGTKLPSERQLADQYGVSRPVVREALRSLVEWDLVEVQPGRGAYVRRAQATDAAHRLDALLRRHQATPRDLVEARTMLECTAASLAAARAGMADLGAMESALTRFDDARGIVEQARYDLVFHLAIARAARNPVIETLFGSITGLTIEMMLRSLGDPAVTGSSVPYHRQIRDAIADGDGDRASALMARHLAVAAEMYGEDYERGLESVARRELERLLSPGVTLDDLLLVTASDGEGEDEGVGPR